ncbi:hypothetical protein AAFC00_001807 [Neodothiora populina]|uniref:G-patch domain-containing protein n=1 Tax=Neodothiora populina TaxID=2781224 RepID=A0ABR3PQ63_9PEZI
MATAEEEDDYMSMSFADPDPTPASTSLQRKQQARKHAELRGRPKSKAELEAEAAAKRESALAASTISDPSSKGARLMAKLGYKGGALGNAEDARTQPIQVEMKGDRGGIGADSEKKRKVREYMDAVQTKEKRHKVDENEFRERNRREREEKRNEGMMWGAMRIAEKFDTEAVEEEGQTNDRGSDDAATPETASAGRNSTKPNLLWRALVYNRADKERERAHRSEVSQGLGASDDEDADDKLALGTEIEELESEDVEFDQFNALDPAERLRQIVEYLRETYNYCFWCKYRYTGDAMKGCPGKTEEDHD